MLNDRYANYVLHAEGERDQWRLAPQGDPWAPDNSLWQVETPQARENSSQLELRMGTAIYLFLSPHIAAK